MGCLISSNGNACSCLPICSYTLKPLTEADNNADWMSHVARHNPGISFNDLKMVETHNAASSYIEERRCLSSVSRTQRLTLKRQLELGIRALDLRFAPLSAESTCSNTFSVQHGMHRGAEFYSIFNDINDFMISYTDEFIVLNFKYEGKSRIAINHSQLSNVIVSIYKAFSDSCLTDDDYNGWFKRGDVSIAELIKTKKRLLITIHRNCLDQMPENRRQDFKQFIRSHNIFFKPEVISSRWHNCEDYSELFQRSSKHILDHVKDHKLMSTQLILTPKTSSILKYISCVKSMRVDQNIKVLLKNNRLNRHIRSMSTHDTWNYLAMDLVDYMPSKIRFVVGLNFDIDLQIVKAAIYVNDLSIDITDKLASMILKRNSIWILSWLHDVGVKLDRRSYSRLDIVYRLDSRFPPVSESYDIRESDDFLMNGFTLLKKTEDGDVEINTPSTMTKARLIDDDYDEDKRVIQITAKKPFDFKCTDI